ncbi:MAG: helix-turn-helix transcriptional regulator [Bacteroidales bacterium]|nr:helix-turn-helix transcriptional regulator [Bacteroidales bacterium]
MVCNRCIKVVREELGGMGYTITSIELGEVELKDQMDDEGRDEIRKVLTNNGFELIDDRKSLIINKIKTLIIEYIHYDKEKPEYVNLSEFLASELGHDYSYLSYLFSSVEGITIEKYLILQKVEKVKELLVYDELSLSEISYKLGYSSVQHLSNQFKKITGLSSSHFKKIRKDKRKPLDQV